MTLSSSGADAVQNQHRTGVAQMNTYDSYVGRCPCAINDHPSTVAKDLLD
jgi:hypothetical protein